VVHRVGQFLTWVSTKLNKGIVKELVTHRYDGDTDCTNVMFNSALKDRRNLVEVMLSHLEESDRREVRRTQVDIPQEYNRRTGYKKLFWSPIESIQSTVIHLFPSARKSLRLCRILSNISLVV
jgi:hypothetical protein